MTKPRVTDIPTLGARVTNRRGGDPWPGSSLTVTELPSEANGGLVLARDPDGTGRWLHPSPTHPGRWNLGSRTVAFVAAPAEQATGSAEPADVVVTATTPHRVLPVGSCPQLHMGVEVTGPFGARVTCGCGLSTRGHAKRDIGRAWDEHNAHALSALREAVSVAYAMHGDFPPVTIEQRDAVFDLVRGASNVWRTHPAGGTFTAVVLSEQPHPFYLRLFGSSSGAVGYTPRFGEHVELRLTPHQVAQLRGATS